MYKKQLTFQKIVCIFCLIAVAVTFVYSLGIMTDLYDAFYYITDPDDLDDSKVAGSRIFYDMQEFNRQFVNLAVILILLACLLYLTNTHNRRRYYIGNIVAVGAYSGGVLYAVWWAGSLIEIFKNQFLTTVDFAALKEYADKWDSRYLGPEDTFLFDLHKFTDALCILAVVLLVANMIWKFLLMRSEKKLIEAGKEAAV